MTARDVANECLHYTHAEKLSGKAQEVALIAIACATEDRKEWRRLIKENYRKRNPNCGSFFLIFILPLLISLVSNWLAKWIFKGYPSGLEILRADALNALG